MSSCHMLNISYMAFNQSTNVQYSAELYLKLVRRRQLSATAYGGGVSGGGGGGWGRGWNLSSSHCRLLLTLAD